MKNIVGWMIQLADDPLHPDSFHITDPESGRIEAVPEALRFLD